LDNTDSHNDDTSEWSRNEATAKGLVKILGPLQDKGIIGSDKCVIL
jgi:hypothetical protein